MVVEMVEEAEGGEKSWKAVISTRLCEGRTCYGDRHHYEVGDSWRRQCSKEERGYMNRGVIQKGR